MDSFVEQGLPASLYSAVTRVKEPVDQSILDFTDPFAQLCGFTADRYKLMGTIRGNRDTSITTVADRCFLSSLVYQVPSTGLTSHQYLANIEKWIEVPDLILWLDVDYETIRSRTQESSDFIEQITLRSEDEFDIARGNYTSLYQTYASRFNIKRVDCTNKRSAFDIHKEIINLVRS
jgi:thymidylate kinase